MKTTPTSSWMRGAEEQHGKLNSKSTLGIGISVTCMHLVLHLVVRDTSTSASVVSTCWTKFIPQHKPPCQCV